MKKLIVIMCIALSGCMYQSINFSDIDAAKQGLEVFAEHTVDARTHPGKHPNIDRLLAIAESGAETLRVKHVFAVVEDLPA